jgi:carbon storage regulator CsrA
MEVKDGKRLVVTRHEGESVVIGDPNKPIGTVEVIKIIGSNKVRLAFKFPASIHLHREEIADRILDSNKT